MAEKPIPYGFNSFNCVDVFIDEPSDKTFPPVSAIELERTKELRDRIRAALAAGVDLSEQAVYIDEPSDTTACATHKPSNAFPQDPKKT